MFFSSQSKKISFTLVELLVVIAVIGLLSALVIIAVSSMVIKGRDARRAGDTRSMQSAVELYFNDYYPIWVGGGCTSDPNNPLTTALISTYMSILPQDPLSSQYCYHYISNSDGSLYKLSAYMEKNITLAQNDGGTDSTYYELFNLSGGTQMKLYLDNLAGYWQMNEETGTIAKDYSASHKDGILGGSTLPTWQSPSNCIGGSCLSFDGSTSTINLDNLAVNTSAGAKNTVSFWMKWTGGTTPMPFGWTSYDLWLYSNCFGFNTGESNVFGISSSGLLNTWTYVVTVFYNGVPDAVNNAIYINGLKQSISSCKGTTTASRSVTTSAAISGWRGSSGYKFGGLIDDFRIYNYALSDCQVCELCRNTWTKGQCSNCTDCSGN